MSPSSPPGLDPSDIPLFEHATTLLSKHYIPGRHEVSTALLLSSGEIISGLHVEGSCGRSSICAEGMALGASLLKIGDAECGETVTVVAVVAVLYILSTGKIRMIAPCGVCRELLFDYCPDARCYTWTPGTATVLQSPIERSGDQRGFDLGETDIAAGKVKMWKVRDLLPQKTKRVGW